MNITTNIPINRWKEYKRLFLNVMLSCPYAFGETIEEEKQRLADEWKNDISYSSKKRVFFMENNNILVGSLIASIEGDNIGKLYSLIVLPEFQKQGIATKLLDEGLRWLKSYNVEIAELKVTTKQEKAFKLYKKFGFEIFYLWEKASRVSRKKYKDITRISVEYYSYYCMRLHIP